MAINVKPLGDRVLVKPLEEKEVKKGDIIIPENREREASGRYRRSREHWQARRQWQEDRIH
jgi:hypothetical protein